VALAAMPSPMERTTIKTRPGKRERRRRGIGEVLPEEIDPGLPSSAPDLVFDRLCTTHLGARSADSIFGGHAMAHVLVDGLAQESFELLIISSLRALLSRSAGMPSCMLRRNPIAMPRGCG
jgi:hypothetical protein